MPETRASTNERYFVNAAMHESVLCATNSALWSWNVDTDELFLSDSFYATTGLELGSQCHFSDFLNLLTPADSKTLLAAIESSRSQDRNFDCQLHLFMRKQFCQVKFSGRSRITDDGQERVIGLIQVSDVNTAIEPKYDFFCTDTDFGRELFASEHLEKSLYYNIIKHAQTAVVIKNLEGAYLLSSRIFRETFCPSLTELDLANSFEIFGIDLAQRFKTIDQLIIQSKYSSSGVNSSDYHLIFEYNNTLYTSTHFPLMDDLGELYAIGQVITDVSRRRFVSEQTKQHQNEMGVLLDSVRSHIWYLDSWGNIKDGNRLANYLMPIDKIKGKSFSAAMPFWEDPARRQRELKQVIRTATPVYDSLERANISGVARCYKVDKVPTLDCSGSVTGVLLVMNDVTEAYAKEKELIDSKIRFRSLIETTTDAIWCYEIDPGVDITKSAQEQVTALDASSELADCNHEFALLCGANSIESLIGTSFSRVGFLDLKDVISEFISNNYRLIDYEVGDKGKLPNIRRWQLTVTGNIENNRLIRIWGTAKEITQSKTISAEIEYQTSHDPLTKLPNRVGLYNEIKRALKCCGTGPHAKKNMALLLIDLDHFKEINDTLGHHAGDKLLKEIGPRLQEEMDGLPGMVARLGGDEFAVFLPSIRNAQQAVVIAHRMLDTISQGFLVEGFYSEVSASIGVSLYPNQAKDLSTLMRYADVAMYHAKKETKGVSLYKPDEDPNSPKRLAIMGELRRAIREEQLQLYYQPKFDIRNNEFQGFEALLRWQHPELGMVSPTEFIPIAESTGLIHPLTNWVLESSIKQLCEWRDQNVVVNVAVNLSTRNLMDEGICKNIRSLLEQYQLPPDQLELEITESAIMANPSRALRVLNQIHELGLKLSIDDFGTGYSSLSYLRKLPVQTLKIDYSFVIDMLNQQQDRIIVKSIINLAHNLGIEVVAEGVESLEIERSLKDMQCDYAQGFYYSGPVPIDEALKTMEYNK